MKSDIIRTPKHFNSFFHFLYFFLAFFPGIVDRQEAILLLYNNKGTHINVIFIRTL